jgi:hypothetical protein
MLTAEQNEELTQVAAGTPMGELLRRYWYPVAFTRELEEFPSGRRGCSARTSPCSRRRAAGTGCCRRPARTAAPR